MEECIICFDETTEFMFYRCAHKVCAKCYPKIKTCPVCKTPLEIVVVQPRQTTVVSGSVAYKLICCTTTVCFILLSLYIFFGNCICV